MMKLALLRRQSALVEPMCEGPELKVVGTPSPLLAWPVSVSDPVPADAGEAVTADLRTKLFSGNVVERDQYTATVNAAGRSLSAVLTALAETCSSVDEFGRVLGTDDHLILNVQIRL